jgi:peptidoglycan-N-acetylglucosamine deacetylase
MVEPGIGRGNALCRSAMKTKALFLLFALPLISAGLSGKPGVAGRTAVMIHGSRTEKKIALTFDACSSRGKNKFDSTIANILLKTNTPATFFLGGRWMEQNPKTVKLLAQQPQFELGLHGYNHPHLGILSDDSIHKELQQNQQVLSKLTGKKAGLFRPPYGEYDERIVKLVSQEGLTLVEYDLASGDPDTSATKEKLIEYVSSMARNGSVVVMHINGRGWHTAEALPEMIRRLGKRGFQLVKVSDLQDQEQ